MKLAHTTTINEFVTESEKILVNKPQLPVTPLEYAARISNPNGEWLEFGTGSGESTTIMSKERMGTNRVYTFDSFLGLPENWGSLTHSLTHSLIHSFTHSLIHSFTHSLTQVVWITEKVHSSNQSQIYHEMLFV